jgi:hypothetical protein
MRLRQSGLSARIRLPAARFESASWPPTYPFHQNARPLPPDRARSVQRADSTSAIAAVCAVTPKSGCTRPAHDNEGFTARNVLARGGAVWQ